MGVWGLWWLGLSLVALAKGWGGWLCLGVWGHGWGLQWLEANALWVGGCCGVVWFCGVGGCGCGWGVGLAAVVGGQCPVVGCCGWGLLVVVEGLGLWLGAMVGGHGWGPPCGVVVLGAAVGG